MTRYFTMHPENPQPRLINQAAAAIQAGELLVYPTDSTYAIGCSLTSKTALEKLRKVRGLPEKHPLTLMCHSIKDAAKYCLIPDRAFQILKEYTPGPYTFILSAMKGVPKIAQGTKRKVVGIRIPDHPIPLALIAASGTPLFSTTLWVAGEEHPTTDPHSVVKKTAGLIDLILDGGEGGEIPTTIIDLSQGEPTLVRQGKGDNIVF